MRQATLRFIEAFFILGALGVCFYALNTERTRKRDKAMRLRMRGQVEVILTSEQCKEIKNPSHCTDRKIAVILDREFAEKAFPEAYQKATQNEK